VIKQQEKMNRPGIYLPKTAAVVLLLFVTMRRSYGFCKDSRDASLFFNRRARNRHGDWLDDRQTKYSILLNCGVRQQSTIIGADCAISSKSRIMSVVKKKE
jgi:hypothetical protein